MNLDQYIAWASDPKNQPIGNTPENMGECVGLIEPFFRDNMDPQVWGNAKDLVANADSDYYSVGLTWPAPRGAAACFNWAPYGHTALSLGDGRLFEQNNPLGSKPHVSNYGSSKPKGYIGYVLPKNLKGDIQMPASQDKIDDLTVRLGYNIGLFRQPTDQEIQGYIDQGLTVEQFMRAILSSDEHTELQGKTADFARQYQDEVAKNESLLSANETLSLNLQQADAVNLKLQKQLEEAQQQLKQDTATTPKPSSNSSDSPLTPNEAITLDASASLLQRAINWIRSKLKGGK